MKKIVIASACRTAIGKFGGTLAKLKGKATYINKGVTEAVQT